MDRTAQGYQLNSKLFPTVYSAVASLVGVSDHAKQNGKAGTRSMSAWSSKRFWAPEPPKGGAKKKVAPKKKKKAAKKAK